MESNYVPINCSFYDRIEAIAVQRKVVEIIFIDDKDKEIKVSSKIKDTATRKDGEFVILELDNLEIRMDRILSLDGHLMPGTSMC